MLFEVLASGAFDHLNCKHTGEFDQIFSKKSNVWRVCLREWGEGQLELTSSIFQRCMQGCN